MRARECMCASHAWRQPICHSVRQTRRALVCSLHFSVFQYIYKVCWCVPCTSLYQRVRNLPRSHAQSLARPRLPCRRQGQQVGLRGDSTDMLSVRQRDGHFFKETDVRPTEMAVTSEAKKALKQKNEDMRQLLEGCAAFFRVSACLAGEPCRRCREAVMQGASHRQITDGSRSDDTSPSNAQSSVAAFFRPATRHL